MRRELAWSTLAAIVGAVLLLQGCSPEPTPEPSNNTTTTSTSFTTTTTTTTTTTIPGWGCRSSKALKHAITLPEKKGFAVDDDTIIGCSDKMLEVWPHSSNENVKSLRLFAAWTADWPEEGREPFWSALKDFVQRNDAKVLLGTGVHCEQAYDQQHWDWTLRLMKFLGKERIMGVAFGNEMDNEKRCSQAFQDDKFIDLIKPRVDAMDAAGFADVPITVVWTMGALADKPFNSKINSFLASAHNVWGDRWVWTFNPYPLWDHGMQPQNANECQKVQEAVKIDFTKAVMGEARKRVTQVTKNSDSKIWVGEAGWSSPGVPAHASIVKACPSWASDETFFTYYENLMAWDLFLDTGKPVDHLFFFTMRDSRAEAFGLVNECGSATCKVQAQEEMLAV